MVKMIDRHAVNSGARLGNKLRIAVFAEDVGLNRTRLNLRLIRQDSPQPRRIEERAAADDLPFRRARELLRNSRQDIYRVRDE